MKIKEMAMCVRDKSVVAAHHVGSSIQHVAGQTDAALVMGFAGIAACRPARVQVALGVATLGVATVVGGKLLPFCALAFFGSGMVRGFKTAMWELKKEEVI